MTAAVVATATGLKPILFVDKETHILYRNALKTLPFVCKKHHCYINDKLMYKKGKHRVDMNGMAYQLVDL